MEKTAAEKANFQLYAMIEETYARLDADHSVLNTVQSALSEARHSPEKDPYALNKVLRRSLCVLQDIQASQLTVTRRARITIEMPLFFGESAEEAAGKLRSGTRRSDLTPILGDFEITGAEEISS
jgi:hypothetical protein